MPIGPATSARRDDLDQLLAGSAGRIRAVERNVADPTLWIYVGSGAPAPDFQNGFTNSGGSRVPLRYRILRPYDMTLDPTVDNPSGIEIQGSVTGGGLGLTIFSLLEPQWFPDGTANWQTITRDYDVHLTALNDASQLVVVTITQAGDVIYGFV